MQILDTNLNICKNVYGKICLFEILKSEETLQLPLPIWGGAGEG